VNGDGYADVIVGAPGVNSGTGKIYLFQGSAAGLTGSAASPTFSASGEGAGAYFGGVASAGDVNGDGYADVIVGASGANSSTGKIYLFQGSAAGLTGSAANPAFSATGETAGDRFGGSVAGAGDVNGDGYADVIVGARAFDEYRGKVYVFHGGPWGLTGSAASPAFSATGERAGDEFGVSVAGAGDVNGDGYADVIVGKYGSDISDFAGNPPWGKVYLFQGSAAGLIRPAAFSIYGGRNTCFGVHVAGVGDVNGDGFADFIVGAPCGGDYTGMVHLYQGGAAGLTVRAAFSASGEAPSNFFGTSSAGAGDVNGDGYADVIVGAPGYSGSTGKVYLFQGGGSGRLVLASQLRSGDDPGQVQPWGLSLASDSLRVALQATSPAGRQRVKLQVQVCPPGVAFGNAACAEGVSPTWTDVTTATSGVLLQQVVSGLEPGSLQRWRARVLYAPFSVIQAGVTLPPNPAAGPWRRLNGQATEADVRINGAPAGHIDVFAAAPGVAPNGTVTISAALTPAQAGVVVSFNVTSGGGWLSNPSSVTDGNGVAAVIYTAGASNEVVQIDGEWTGAPAVRDRATVFVATDTSAGGIQQSTAGAYTVGNISPNFIQIVKQGAGTPMLGWAEFAGNPCPASSPGTNVVSPFVDAMVEDVAGVDQIVVTLKYTGTVEDAGQYEPSWCNNGVWQPVSATLNVYTVTSTLVFTLTGATSPTILQLDGTPFVGVNVIPAAVTVGWFSATEEAGRVLLTWQTFNEVGLTGFHLYRGTDAAGPGERITGDPLPSQGAGGLDGFAYAYDDFTPRPPETAFYYWLEELHSDGGVFRHGPQRIGGAGSLRVFLPAISQGGAAPAAEPPPAANETEPVPAEPAPTEDSAGEVAPAEDAGDPANADEVAPTRPAEEAGDPAAAGEATILNYLPMLFGEAE